MGKIPPKPPVDTGKLKKTPGWVSGYVEAIKAAAAATSVTSEEAAAALSAASKIGSTIDYANALLTPSLTTSQVKKIMQARGATIPLTEAVAHTKPAEPIDDAAWLAKLQQDSVPDTHASQPEFAPMKRPKPTRKRRIILDD